MMTHLPRSPFCDTCEKANVQRRLKIQRAVVLIPDTAPRRAPVKCCDQAIGYHFIRNGSGPDGGEDDPGFPTDTVAVVLFDRPTKRLAVYHTATKTAHHTIEAMQHFAGPKDHISSFYCDNAPELFTSARACKWRLATATPGIPQTNGVADRSVRIVKEGG